MLKSLNSQSPSAPQAAEHVEQKPSAATPSSALVNNSSAIDSQVMQARLKHYRELRKKLSSHFSLGNSALFGNQDIRDVEFPAELLNPDNPANDPKFLHLLCALFGLEELEKHFAAEDQLEERENKDLA